jgi:hypothetical protein
MLRAVLLSAFLALPQIALSAPPAPGDVHTFVDPEFQETVLCDRVEEVEAIALADDPAATFRQYFAVRNEFGEPVCAAVVPTGRVVALSAIGIMQQNGRHYRAWAVEIRVGDRTGVALYLEFFERVTA